MGEGGGSVGVFAGAVEEDHAAFAALAGADEEVALAVEVEGGGVAEAGDFEARWRGEDGGFGEFAPEAESVVGGDGDVLRFAEAGVVVEEGGLGARDGLDAGVDDGWSAVVEDGGSGEAAFGVG